MKLWFAKQQSQLLKSEGQFAAEWTGQFAAELVGLFGMEQVGQFTWNFQA